MIFFHKSSLLFFIFFITFSVPSNAVIDYKLEVVKKNTIAKKHTKTKKKGLVKKWKEKVVLKKLNKIQKKIEKSSINKKANTSRILGIVSFLMLIVGIISGPSLAILVIAGLLAVGVDIMAISILKKTKNEKEKYKKERRVAKWGLTFSLLTGLIPLLAFLILLIALA